MLSYWEQNSLFKPYDFVIVGGGIVGLSTAIYLKKKKKNLRVAIIEKSPLPMGASSRNAGFACFGSVSEILDDLAHLPIDRVFELIELRYNGFKNLQKLLGDKTLNLKMWGGLEVFKSSEEALFDQCNAQIPYLNTELKCIVGKRVFESNNSYLKQNELNQFSNAIYNRFEGQIDSGRMMRGLLDLAYKLGVEIFFGVSLQSYEKALGSTVTLKTNLPINLKTNTLVFCTNGFTHNILPNLKVEPARNLVMITKPIKGLKLKGTFHYQKGYFYFRNVGKRVLIGGGRHLDFENEKTDKLAANPIIEKALMDLLKNDIIPEKHFEIEQKWQGIMGVGTDRFPIVKWVEPNVFCAVKLGGMGVAMGSALGKKSAEILLSN
jgi:gamma-glutamylputrescine oxidase